MATHTVDGVVYSYTYDDIGNITSVSENGTLRANYYYDSLGQLGLVNYYSDRYYSEGYVDTYEYWYDKSGNITNVCHNYGPDALYSESKTYTYGNETWGDLLTNYNGTAITYDGIGNPLNWRNANNIEWQGRSLKLFDATNGKVTEYTYNADGIRTQKKLYNAGGNLELTVNYILDGSKIIAENRNGTYIYYVYDEKGAIMGMMYGGEMYTFRKNLQGDVTGIYNANGNLVVEYTYSPYGEVLSTTGSMASTIGTANPFRYRGYYYDTETGFYYLQSRYYDPVVGRFLNADAFVSTGQGILGNNTFAYCLNSPIMCCDNIGQSPVVAIPAAAQCVPYALAAVVVLGVILAVSSDDPSSKDATNFTDGIYGIYQSVKDRISEAHEEAKTSNEEKRAARGRAIEMQKVMDTLKKLNNEQCAIIYLDGKTPKIYRIMYTNEAISEIRADYLSGVNCVIPPNQTNWGVFTNNSNEALRIFVSVFGSAEADLLWLGHSPLPHFHVTGHWIKINGFESKPHAWYLN